MEEEATFSGWQYPLAAGAGFLIVLAYIMASVVFLGYIMFLISQLYQWIILYGAKYSMFWGVVIGILAFIGVLLATILAIVVVMFLVNKFKHYRLEKKIIKT